MEKCEWKDGRFDPCKTMVEALEDGYRSEFPTEVLNNKIYWYCQEMICCPFCGADIRKPVVEPIIKRSGETWVILSNEIDYMIIDRNKYEGYKSLSGYTQNDLLKDIAEGGAVPIPEIEITDEIAKRRPMVTAGGAQTYDLLAIKQNRAIINSEWDDLDWILISDIKLATVKDLE